MKTMKMIKNNENTQNKIKEALQSVYDVSYMEDLFYVISAYIAREKKTMKEKENLFFISMNEYNHIVSIYSFLAEEISKKYPIEVFKKAIAFSAKGVVIARGKKGKCSENTKKYMEVINKYIEFGKIMNIPVLDYLIVSIDDYTSFKKEGII